MKATSITRQTSIASMSEVCALFHLKRDAFYKYIKRWERYKSVESQVIQLVKEERKEQPRVGVRKLHETLQPSFEAKQIKIPAEPSPWAKMAVARKVKNKVMDILYELIRFIAFCFCSPAPGPETVLL